MNIIGMLQAAAEYNQSYAAAWGLMGAGLGAGLAAIGAAIGIGRIGGQAADGIARQPEMAGKIQGAALILAAFIEGVALFAVVLCLLISLKFTF